jgi:hypothetical protein
MRDLEKKVSSPPLRFGKLIHESLELYYPVGIKRGPHPANTFKKVYQEELVEAEAKGYQVDAEWEEHLWLGIDMLEHYVDTYGKDEHWEILATELQFVAPITNNAGEVIGEYVGVLDNVMRNRSDKTIWFRDHKTAKSIDTSYLAMDDQSSGYWTFGPWWLRKEGILGPKQNISGIEFNFLRKAFKDDRPKNDEGQYLNKDGSVSKVQPPPHFHQHLSFRGEHERELTRQRCVAELYEIAMVRDAELALLKSPDKMNCKFCDVRDICELHETGSDWQAMMKMIMQPREDFIKIAVDYEHEH